MFYLLRYTNQNNWGKKTCFYVYQQTFWNSFYKKETCFIIIEQQMLHIKKCYTLLNINTDLVILSLWSTGSLVVNDVSRTVVT